MSTAYEQLAELVLPTMKDYQTDLTCHDLAEMEQYPDVPFLHYTRENGTYLIMMYPAESPFWPKKGIVRPYLFGHAKREHWLTSSGGMAEHLAHPMRRESHHLVMSYDGHTLIQVTHDEAVYLAKEWMRKVLWAWRKGKA